MLAVVTFLAFWVQTVGLADTTPGKNAFLTATYCVIVPFMLWAVAGKRPTFANVGAAALCIIGHRARVAHRPARSPSSSAMP